MNENVAKLALFTEGLISSIPTWKDTDIMNMLLKVFIESKNSPDKVVVLHVSESGFNVRVLDTGSSQSIESWLKNTLNYGVPLFFAPTRYAERFSSESDFLHAVQNSVHAVKGVFENNAKAFLEFVNAFRVVEEELLRITDMEQQQEEK